MYDAVLNAVLQVAPRRRKKNDSGERDRRILLEENVAAD
jgi:hypothetical protein